MADFTGADALSLLGAIPFASLCVNAAGTIVFANDAAIAMAGACASLLRTPVSALFPDWHSLSATANKSSRRETVLLRKDDSTIPVELSLVRFDGNNSLTGILIRDLIDEKALVSMRLELERQNEDALAEAEAAQRRLRFIIDMLPQAACVFDAQDRYVLWNEKYSALYPEIADHLRPGMPFREILKLSLDSGDTAEVVDDREQWLEHRMERHNMAVSQQEQMLRDGRWLRHDDRRTPDGGAIGMRIDITDLKRREESVRLLFDANPMPMMLCDAASLHIVDVNQAAIALYGYSREEMLAKRAIDFHVGSDGERLDARLRDLDDNYEDRTIWLQKSAIGTEHHVLIYVRILNEVPARRLLLTIADVSDRIRAEAHATHLAHHDAMTGLPNRMQFHQYLAKALQTVARDGGELAVLYLDLDKFKPVNDTFGHATGDIVLMQVAERLKSILRIDDMVARLGGDEFAILQHDCSASADAVADRCIRILEKPFAIAGRQIAIGVSIGIAIAPGNGLESDELMKAADAALYQAKATGKSTWRRSKKTA